jgi:hypothetical protein
MRAALLLFVLVASPAWATCQEEEIFSCPIGKKVVEVCSWRGEVTYSFGRQGSPEIILYDPLETVDYTPWPGIGRAIWDMVAFQNEGVTYEVWSSFDRLDENAVMEGGVNVMKGDDLLATLTCEKGKVDTALDRISELKAGIGQCWDYDARLWTTDCP